jgi:CrcB protein
MAAKPNAAADPRDAGTLGAARPSLPLHLHPGYIAVVGLGGVPGALARYGLELALPAPAGWPLPTLVINLAGAFILGFLLEALARRGADHGRRRILRLLIGTGFVGAFTTYSTFAVEADRLLASGRPLAALAYLAATVIGGVLASVLGIWVASVRRSRRSA